MTNPDHRRWLRTAWLAYPIYATLRDAPGGDAGMLPGAAPGVAVAVLLCAALLAVRRYPVAVALIALAGFVVESHPWPLLAALFEVAVRGRLRVAAGLTLAAGVPMSVPALRELVNMPVFTLAPCAFVFVPVACGLAVRSHRDRAHALARRLELRDERIRTAERERIAREMHDVLAHRLSLVALHAGVLQRRASEVPAPVRDRLALLRATSTSALDDMRDLLGALRDPVAPDRAPLTPVTDDLPGLIRESEEAGTRVHRDLAELTGLPAAVRLAAHRIVQEALTNARKHAPGRPVRLTVRPEAGRLVI
ncbi:sensor histidine kinase [Streptomyces otsuchiensis]|nr:histidine kinase [Streptomyces otsuchiensis]